MMVLVNRNGFVQEAVEVDAFTACVLSDKKIGLTLYTPGREVFLRLSPGEYRRFLEAIYRQLAWVELKESPDF